MSEDDSLSRMGLMGAALAALIAMPVQGLAETFWISDPIETDTVWTSGNTYIMTRDIPVMTGVTLTVENGVTVLIKNGLVPFSPYSPNQRAALTFRSGSRLLAHHLVVSACDATGSPVAKAENGGLNFLGTSRKATKGFLTNDLFAPPSLFTADRIETHYLGSEDKYIYPIRPSRKIYEVDDWDAYSLIGLGPQEWQIPEVVSDHSGQNGIDVVNSVLRLKRLTVEESIEDGVNLTSTQLEIANFIRIHFSGTPAWDVNLFDFESDQGFSWLRIDAGSSVQLRGIFGDQVMLVSPEMPPPPIVDDRFIYECCEVPLTQEASIVRF